MERLSYGKSDSCGPFRWPKLCRQCAGKHQSPIAIYTCNLHQEIATLKFFGIAKIPKCVYIKNIENCIRFEFNWPTVALQPPSVCGIPLPSKRSFLFSQMHFHWSDKDNNGSEHCVDDVFYTMELHMVFFNSKYKTFENAINNSDGVAVIGFFIQSNPHASLRSWLVKALKKVRETNAYVNIKAEDDDIFTIFDMMEQDSFNFYSYKGSLTTPLYNECVTWIIAEEPLQFHPDVINEFRKLRNQDNQLIRNCRPLQKLGCRKVFYFVPSDQ